MVPLHFALVRYHLDYDLQLWVPRLDKYKVRNGSPGEYWTGVNHAQATETLAKL